MGTRHLICVKRNGVTFGQYSQWHGYPDGNGLEVLRFLLKMLENGSEERFVKNFQNAKMLTPEEVEALGDSWLSTHPQLSRDMSAQILDYVLDTEHPVLYNQIRFAADSLFCEWAYLLDFDTREFVTFEGGNHSPLPEGAFFKDMEKNRDPDKYEVKMGYYPIKEVNRVQFDTLDCKQLASEPSKIESQWLSAVTPDEDD